MIYRTLLALSYIFVPDAETAHRLALAALRVIGVWPYSSFFTALTRVRDSSLTQTVFGLRFENPVGLAGGFDKNGTVVPGLDALGFGFIEVGSVTNIPQPGNPRPRLFRFPRERAIVNRMGFNNDGAEALAEHLKNLTHAHPIGISLGKSKPVSLDDAANDYLASLVKLYPHGDYFVVNVSSPNTPGLRDLQDKDRLAAIVGVLDTHRRSQRAQKPILIKIAPDLSFEAIDQVLEVARGAHADGIIATNTTLSREGVPAGKEIEGGLSGKPLAKRATEIIRYVRQKMPELPIIGVGGIFTAEDAYEKVRAGASLLQVYTGFIYEGPFVAARLNRGLVKLLKRDGYKNISEAIGVDVP